MFSTRAVRVSVRSEHHQQRDEKVKAKKKRKHDTRGNDRAELVQHANGTPEHGNDGEEGCETRGDDGFADFPYRVLGSQFSFFVSARGKRLRQV
ncbi:MAG: hypothetical protein ACKVKX_10065 [Pseudomonadales bacterium]